VLSCVGPDSIEQTPDSARMDGATTPIVVLTTSWSTLKTCKFDCPARQTHSIAME
jgi:hypothetical protein